MWSLGQVTDRGAASAAIKQSLSAAGLGNGQFLGQIVESRYVIDAVFIHHAHQLGVHNLQGRGHKGSPGQQAAGRPLAWEQLAGTSVGAERTREDSKPRSTSQVGKSQVKLWHELNFKGSRQGRPAGSVRRPGNL